jgi:hypothetical protein
MRQGLVWGITITIDMDGVDCGLHYMTVTFVTDADGFGQLGFINRLTAGG